MTTKKLLGKPPEDISSRFWRRVEKQNPDACWLWTGAKSPKGYGRVSVGSRTTKTKHAAISSRIAYMLTYGEIPHGLHVLHKCDNPPCCNPTHLFLGTNRDNINDRAAKGRPSGFALMDTRGERHPRARLTAVDVREIRVLIAADDRSRGAVAEKYGVTRNHVNSIVSRRTWRSLP